MPLTYEQARTEIRAMRDQGPRYNVALSTKPVSSNLPDDLAKSHIALSEAQVALAEQRETTAKLVVARVVDHDASSIERLLREGRINKPVADRAIELCDRLRANQMVHLAEGDEMAAQGDAGTADDLMSLLGQLPEQGAVPTGDAAQGTPAPGATPEPDGDEGGSLDEKLDALTQKIAKEQGIPYVEALKIAQQQLAATPANGGGAPAGGAI